MAKKDTNKKTTENKKKPGRPKKNVIGQVKNNVEIIEQELSEPVIDGEIIGEVATDEFVPEDNVEDAIVEEPVNEKITETKEDELEIVNGDPAVVAPVENVTAEENKPKKGIINRMFGYLWNGQEMDY